MNIQHQHVLGTLMSLGIERDQLGDIMIGDEIQFILTKRLESYIMFELTRIKGATVKLNSIPIKDMIQSEENWKIQSATVSALRLDVVLKDMIRKSRNIAKQLIEKKRVKVNHTIVDTPDFQLEKNDLLSIQGFGRAQITEIGGRTKKINYTLPIKHYLNSIVMKQGGYHMPFTPSEIKNKEFTRVKNGLEPTEVANYLDQLSNEIERLKEDKKQLEKVVEDRDTNIKSYQDVHQSVSDALIQAQK